MPARHYPLVVRPVPPQSHMCADAHVGVAEVWNKHSRYDGDAKWPQHSPTDCEKMTTGPERRHKKGVAAGVPAQEGEKTTRATIQMAAPHPTDTHVRRYQPSAVLVATILTYPHQAIETTQETDGRNHWQHSKTLATHAAKWSLSGTHMRAERSVATKRALVNSLRVSAK